MLARLSPGCAALSFASCWPDREDALAAVGLGWPLLRRLLRELGNVWLRPGTSHSATMYSGWKRRKHRRPLSGG